MMPKSFFTLLAYVFDKLEPFEGGRLLSFLPLFAHDQAAIDFLRRLALAINP